MGTAGRGDGEWGWGGGMGIGVMGIGVMHLPTAVRINIQLPTQIRTENYRNIEEFFFCC